MKEDKSLILILVIGIMLMATAVADSYGVTLVIFFADLAKFLAPAIPIFAVMFGCVSGIAIAFALANFVSAALLRTISNAPEHETIWESTEYWLGRIMLMYPPPAEKRKNDDLYEHEKPKNDDIFITEDGEFSEDVL